MSNDSYLEGVSPYPKQVIEEYTAKGWWENLTFGDLLDRSAAKYPDKIAIYDDRTRVTYAQLKDKVDRFAIALLRLGIKKNDRIVVQMPNRYEAVVVYYGVERIGGVTVMAIERHARREISHFFNLTEAVGWILPVRAGKREYMTLIDEVRPGAESLKYLIMIQDREALPPGALSMEKLIDEVNLKDYPEGYLERFRPDPNDVCTLMPTGGTTGLPKMVSRTFNSYMLLIHQLATSYSTHDIRLLTVPFGHNMALQAAVHGTMFNGSTLVMIDTLRPPQILQAIEKHKVTVMSLVPTQLEGILSDPDLEKYDLTSLRSLLTSAAALPAGLADKASKFFGGMDIGFAGSAFGMTEGPGISMSADAPAEKKRISVGNRLSPGTHCKVVDDREREVPPNTEGQLAFNGPSVFTGYYRAPEANREAFTHDGYFLTGDIAKIDEQGYVTITGRSKDTIKRGGEMITPGEIENMLSLHPGIAAVAVVAMPDAKMGEKACAYVVPKPGPGTITFDEMINFLKSEGASVLLLPERLEIISELPLSDVGKIDKKVLRKDIRQKLIQEGVLKE